MSIDLEMRSPRDKGTFGGSTERRVTALQCLTKISFRSRYNLVDNGDGDLDLSVSVLRSLTVCGGRERGWRLGWRRYAEHKPVLCLQKTAFVT